MANINGGNLLIAAVFLFIDKGAAGTMLAPFSGIPAAHYIGHVEKAYFSHSFLNKINLVHS
jgi:hypothetical protein